MRLNGLIARLASIARAPYSHLRRTAATALLCTLAASCALVPNSDHALLVVLGAPEGAVVFVDDEPVGRVTEGRASVSVESGQRRLTVKAPGYEEERLDLSFRRDEVLEVILRLWPDLDGG